MKIVEPGHVYRVEEVDAPILEANPGLIPSQEIRFVRRRDIQGELLPESQRQPGILAQELVRVLIDRVRYLSDELPCAEDVEIIKHARAILRLFEARAARQTIEKMPMPETAPACPICHHILCLHDHPDRLYHDIRRIR